jgi:ATP-binding cassette subfamily B multidrug efflux pump
MGIVFTLVSNLFAIYPAVVIRQSLDALVDNLLFLKWFHGLEQGTVYQSLIQDVSLLALWAGLSIFVLSFFKGLFLFLVRQTIIVVSRRIEFDLKNDIFAHYQKLDMGFFKENATGDLMNRIGEDVSRVRMYLGPAFMYGINLIVLFFLVISTMFAIHPGLTLWVLLPLPFLSLAVYIVNATILKRSERVQMKLSRLSSLVQETFSGIRILKVFNRLSSFNVIMNDEAEEYRKENMGLIKVNAVFFPLVMLLIGISTLLVIVVGGIQVNRGAISPGVIAEFIIYVNMLTWPVASLGWVTSIVQRAAASFHRIDDFLSRPPLILSDDASARTDFSLEGSIRFEKVSFTYTHTGIQAIHDVSLEIPKGKTIGITGPTGSGKSTLMSLIMRFYDPDTGEITIDDKPLTSFPLKIYRSKTGYVPQEVFLFSDTIASNLAFGVEPEPRVEALEAVAELAAVHKDISQMNEGYTTRLGERGITLSGGQKQRIAIARALLRNPDIYLFDDCLSAVDAETEEKIWQNLQIQMQGKTCVWVSHRMSMLAQTDYIYVLDKGKIVQAGTHEDLSREEGYYKNVIYLQGFS